jgi:hypothetical protein
MFLMMRLTSQQGRDFVLTRLLSTLRQKKPSDTKKNGLSRQ